MSVDTRITQALDQAAGGAASRPGAWADIEQRIGRSRRRRRAASAFGVALALAAAALSYAIVERPPEPTTSTEWKTITPRFGAYRLSYPHDWRARQDPDLTITITPPGPPRDASGNLTFSIIARLMSVKYDHRERDPWFLWEDSHTSGTRSAKPSSVTVAGHPAERWEISTSAESSGPPSEGPPGSPIGGSTSAASVTRVLYMIDWPASPPLCASAGPCTLVLDMDAVSADAMQQYLTTSEQIAQSVEIVPAEPLPSVPGVQAKIQLKAGALASGAGAVWALDYPNFDYNLDRLYRIDPQTNAITGSVEVGYLPTAIAADDDSVWVANRRACDEIADCADSQFPGSTDLQGFPAQSSLMRIDPTTLHVVASVEIRNPQDLAIGAGGIWTVDKLPAGAATLMRIDPASNTIVGRIGLPGGGDTPSVTVVDGTVWVSSGGKLHRIDAASNTVTATYDVVGTFIKPSPDSSQLWVAGAANDARTFLRVHPDDGRIIVSISASAMYQQAGGAHSIWAVGGSGSFQRFDADGAGASEVTYLGDNPPVGVYGLTTGFGSVWAALDDGTVWRISQ
jgi:hypothetical protein